MSRKKVWVCGACGRTAESPYGFSDVSCAMNATLCYEDKLEYREEEEAVVKKIKKGGVVDPQPDWSEDYEDPKP